MDEAVRQLLHCVSCGDLIGPWRSQPFDVQDQMRVRCLECSREVLGLGIPVVGNLQRGTGGGKRVVKETKTH